MSRAILVVLLIIATSSAIAAEVPNVDPPVPNVVLGLHGGIGDADQELSPELEQRIREVMEQSLRNGHAKWRAGGSSLDVVEAAIRVLEDSPLFNAGKGAVFTHAGTNELDASIMDGRTRVAGAVASVMTVKNPIVAARAVMEKSKHVLLIGRGAEEFAQQQGLEIVDPEYFRTEHRWKALQDALERERVAPPPGNSGLDSGKKITHGTVGAVALDRAGNLASGTSTGGMTNKMSGRVGDSPIIGAGTCADNAAGAVSCTGHGEYFIRFSVAHEILAQMKYRGLSAQAAAHDVINVQLPSAVKRQPDDAEGAAIVLDRFGCFTAAYNSPHLFRAYITQDGTVGVRLR